MELPDEAVRHISAYEPDESGTRHVDVPLWTIEEGFSDLMLSPTVRDSHEGVDVVLDDVRVP